MDKKIETWDKIKIKTWQKKRWIKILKYKINPTLRITKLHHTPQANLIDWIRAYKWGVDRID